MDFNEYMLYWLMYSVSLVLAFAFGFAICFYYWVKQYLKNKKEKRRKKNVQ
jgi:hypothetical protein